MATQLKRFMVSVDADMDRKLKEVKRKEFYEASKCEMLRYLIGLGLEASKSGNSSSVEEK